MNSICTRWMNLRIEAIGNIAVGGAAFFAVLARGSLSASIAGLSITKSLEITSGLGWMLKSIGDTEIRMAAMERIMEYIGDTPQEKAFDEPKAPKNWPSQGKITIKQTYFRYRPELPNVIKDLNIQVNSCEKVLYACKSLLNAIIDWYCRQNRFRKINIFTWNAKNC